MKLQFAFCKGYNGEQWLLRIIEIWLKYLDLALFWQSFPIPWFLQLSTVDDFVECIWRRHKFFVIFSILPWENEPKSKDEWMVVTIILTTLATFHNVSYQVHYHFINIHICDLFFRFEDLDVASYAGDNTLYTCSTELDVTLKNKYTNKYVGMISWQFLKIYRWKM